MEEGLEEMRSAAAAGRSYANELPISLTVRKRTASVPAGGKVDKEGKRAKAEAAAKKAGEKEGKGRTDFADRWCNACLQKGHPASITELSVCLSAAGSGKPYAPIPESFHPPQRKERFEAWCKASHGTAPSCRRTTSVSDVHICMQCTVVRKNSP